MARSGEKALALPAAMPMRTRPDGIYKGALRSGTPKYISVFGDKDRAFSGHGDQDVSRSVLLQFLRVGDHFILRAQRDAVDISEFALIGLDEPGAAAERPDKEIFFCVDDDADPLSLEPLHDPLVDVAGE